MQSIRELLSSGTGKVIGIGFVVACLAAAFYSISGFLGATEAAASSSDRVYINAKTGEKQFVTISKGFMTPADSYEAEKCFWTKDGKPKDDPTYVLTNEAQGKPGPTFCPDCDRRVVPLNPPASTINPAPPTKSEWEARKQDRPTPNPTEAQN
jgi:hypothetical protein